MAGKKTKKPIKSMTSMTSTTLTDCPEGKIVNPLTGRCISANGKIAQDIENMSKPMHDVSGFVEIIETCVKENKPFMIMGSIKQTTIKKAKPYSRDAFVYDYFKIRDLALHFSCALKCRLFKPVKSAYWVFAVEKYIIGPFYKLPKEEAFRIEIKTNNVNASWFRLFAAPVVSKSKQNIMIDKKHYETLSLLQDFLGISKIEHCHDVPLPLLKSIGKQLPKVQYKEMKSASFDHNPMHTPVNKKMPAHIRKLYWFREVAGSQLAHKVLKSPELSNVAKLRSWHHGDFITVLETQDIFQLIQPHFIWDDVHKTAVDLNYFSRERFEAQRYKKDFQMIPDKFAITGDGTFNMHTWTSSLPQFMWIFPVHFTRAIANEINAYNKDVTLDYFVFTVKGINWAVIGHGKPLVNGKGLVAPKVLGTFSHHAEHVYKWLDDRYDIPLCNIMRLV